MHFNLEILDKILFDFNKHYKYKVDKVYSVQYDDNPEAFILYNLENVDAFLLKADKTYTTYQELYLLVYQGTGKRELYELKNDDYSEFYKYGTDTTEFLIDLVHKKFDTGTFISSVLESHIDSISEYGNYKLWYEGTKFVFDIQTSSGASRHIKKFFEELNEPANTYTKNTYKYVYTDLDFSDTIKLVNDDDFEYGLNESLAAYDNNLYLAATSTAGTALETLIITILEKEKIEFEINIGTELGFLTNLLLKESIINKKMKQRIMNAASLRNLASHANRGRTIREDAKYVFQTIYTLAYEVYLPRA